jgi:hypothetical protein
MSGASWSTVSPGRDQINVEVSDSSASIAQRRLLKTVLITFEITLREEFGKLVSNRGVGFNFISFNNSPRIFDTRGSEYRRLASQKLLGKERKEITSNLKLNERKQAAVRRRIKKFSSGG